MPKWTMPNYESHAVLPNTQPLSVREFAQSSFGTYTPVRVLCGKVPVPDLAANRNIIVVRSGGKAYALATALVMGDGTGYAMACDYHAGTVHYWRFGACMHTNKQSRNLGNCYNEYTCVDCGYGYTVDSSG